MYLITFISYSHSAILNMINTTTTNNNNTNCVISVLFNASNINSASILRISATDLT